MVYLSKVSKQNQPSSQNEKYKCGAFLNTHSHLQQMFAESSSHDGRGSGCWIAVGKPPQPTGSPPPTTASVQQPCRRELLCSRTRQRCALSARAGVTTSPAPRPSPGAAHKYRPEALRDVWGRAGLGICIALSSESTAIVCEVRLERSCVSVSACAPAPGMEAPGGGWPVLTLAHFPAKLGPAAQDVGASWMVFLDGRTEGLLQAETLPRRSCHPGGDASLTLAAGLPLRIRCRSQSSLSSGRSDDLARPTASLTAPSWQVLWLGYCPERRHPDVFLSSPLWSNFSREGTKSPPGAGSEPRGVSASCSHMLCLGHAPQRQHREACWPSGPLTAHPCPSPHAHRAPPSSPSGPFTSPGHHPTFHWGSDLTFPGLTPSLGPALLLLCPDSERGVVPGKTQP